MAYIDEAQQREYRRAWSQRRRARNRSWVQQYKLYMGCADCGYDAHHAALEFDHIGTDKRANVASLMSQDIALWAEIKKCEVVCGNCHNIRTYERMVAADKAERVPME